MSTRINRRGGSLPLALLALLVTLWMPELPLRSGEAPTPALE